MRLLRIESGSGEFLGADGSYVSIEKITKEDLLRLVGLVLDEDLIELDGYDEKSVKNQAHQIIYKSIEERMRALLGRRQEFKDEAARLYLDEYEKYRQDAAK